MSPEDRDEPAELFQLDAATCGSLLRTQQIGRLATAGDTPTIVPVNYVAVNGAIVFHVEAGPHADRLVGQRAAFEVDVIDDRTHSGWSVIAHGRVSTTLPGDSQDVTWPSLQPWPPGDHQCRLAIRVEAMTGRLVRSPVEASTPDAAYL